MCLIIQACCTVLLIQTVFQVVAFLLNFSTNSCTNLWLHLRGGNFFFFFFKKRGDNLRRSVQTFTVGGGKLA